MSSAVRDDAARTQTLIPAAFERRPVTRRQTGVMSGPAFGSLDPPIGPSPMDETTRGERRKEGGGRP
jgi:hypothetical protein